MDRLHKKCFVGSTLAHLFTVALLVFGSAFFFNKDDIKKMAQPRLRIVPGKLIDQALSGGGGNPNLKPDDTAVQKGNTLVQQPAPPPAPPPPKVAEQRPPPEPVQKPPAAVKKSTPKKEATVKPAKDKALAKKPLPAPKEKEADKEMDLPIERVPSSKLAAQRRKAHQAAAEAQARQFADSQKRISKAFGDVVEGLRPGFKDGTTVEVPGPGGEAYASYEQFVQAKYEEAWWIPDSVEEEDGVAKVTVTIARSGYVVQAHITRRSGKTMVDKSVQNALDRVRFIAPFPEGSKDLQRTFIINFNVRAKRGLG